MQRRFRLGQLGQEDLERALELPELLLLPDYLRTSVLEQLKDKVRGAIRAEVQRAVDASKTRLEGVEGLKGQIDGLRRERQRLVISFSQRARASCSGMPHSVSW